MGRPRAVRANDFLNALAAAGILSEGELIRRVVIDAEIGKMVMLYVERFGDARLLAVASGLDGIEVGSAPNRAGEEGSSKPLSSSGTG